MWLADDSFGGAVREASTAHPKALYTSSHSQTHVSIPGTLLRALSQMYHYRDVNTAVCVWRQAVCLCGFWIRHCCTLDTRHCCVNSGGRQSGRQQLYTRGTIQFPFLTLYCAFIQGRNCLQPYMTDTRGLASVCMCVWVAPAPVRASSSNAG